MRNAQQFAKQLEARVLRDRLLAAGWPEEAFDYPTFVRRCSERQCVAYKSSIGETARLFGIRQAERVFRCHSTTALFFRDKAERVDDKDEFEIPKDLVEQTREAIRVEQSRLPLAPPDPLLVRLQEQFQQLVAQQQEQHEKEMRQLQEGQQKQQEQHEQEMRQLQERQRQQQDQHEREMMKLQKMLEREKQVVVAAPQETSQRVVPPLSEERKCDREICARVLSSVVVDGADGARRTGQDAFGTNSSCGRRDHPVLAASLALSVVGGFDVWREMPRGILSVRAVFPLQP